MTANTAESITTEETVTIQVTPQQQQLISNAEQKLAAAEQFQVVSNESYEAAASELIAIKTKAKELDATRKSITKPMDDAKSRVMDLFRKPLEFLGQAEKVLKNSMLTYQQEEERKRREEEAKRQELARKEQERLQKRAETAAKKGQTEKAEMLQEQAEMVPTPVVTTSKPKATGISTRTKFKAKVTDVSALLQGILDGRIPAAAVTINETFLNNQARMLKKELNYPGVEVVTEQELAARAS